jgi:hypothetical protein
VAETAAQKKAKEADAAAKKAEDKDADKAGDAEGAPSTVQDKLNAVVAQIIEEYDEDEDRADVLNAITAVQLRLQELDS